ncbi:hypothetical protein D3C80_1596530 [compost metagenome]
MQRGDGRQRLADHHLLGIGQRRLAFYRAPGVPQALGTVEVFEQQPAALAFLQAIDQQLRRDQSLLGQQSRTIQLALEMPGRLAADQQLGQYTLAAPVAGADIALPRQHPQQAVQTQLGRTGAVGQFQPQWQRRLTPGAAQLGKPHARASFFRRRALRRWHQPSTSAPPAALPR